MEKTAKNTIHLTKIQKLIGKRMLKSKTSKPCFYLQARADVTELMAIRPKLRKKLGTKITTNAFYIHALALAARQFPLMLGVIDGRNIKISDNINVGFAVNAPHGLVVPVIKNADKKTLTQIAQLEKQLTEDARSSRLTLGQIEGETIALSNLGAYGIDSFLGIVPLHATAIMAVGNVIQRPIPIDGSIIPRKCVSLTLAVDNRVVNPDYAARFLKSIVDKLQNPA